MGGRTRKLRNHARRTGLAQASRFDTGAKIEPVVAEVEAPAATVKKKTKKKTKKSQDEGL